MNHFDGIVPEERYKNEMLEETRKIRILLEQLVGGNAQASNQIKQVESKPHMDKRQYRRRGAQ
jgi:sensor domain CHASE-containing protein